MFLGWVDIAMACVLLFSLLAGVWRGLLFEVLSLMGWVVAYFGSQMLAPYISHWVPVGAEGSTLHQVSTLVLAFVFLLLLWGLGARLVRMLVQASPLSGLDRLLGAGFGLIRGLLICLLAVLVVGMTPAARSAQWQDSELVPWMQVVLHGLRPLLPPSMVQYVGS
ncbi:CvpA family protein [Roseateles toxinivorans]|uniref:Membrane protein required for colicin V production n=1 Tax=Roseateles toxinivorans TaxID=270368 RepID=A0A4R6QV17_9BURK|nr:CvpA family protein [Roseateles toxinivorans]TDP75025.1 membrane protein required for colicin V production [Roseateles toxinivorans]